MKDLVSMLCDTHETVKEKVAMWLKLIPAVERFETWQKIDGLISFLSECAVKHFKDEEILIDVIKKYVNLTVEEQQMMSKFLREHEILLAKLENLKETASKYNPGDRKIVDEFTGNSHQIIDELLKHAKEEDEKLFPLAREKLTVKHLKIFEEQLGKTKREAQK
ncbi:MAG: hemerythrin domain-containing protein [Thermoplasmatales archaeon]|nr:hemerythrin domain-containing protein [Thermoplasmatales archaeon]